MPKLLEEDSSNCLDCFKPVIKRDIKILEKQNSRFIFNPHLSWACQMLPEGNSLLKKWSNLLAERALYPQLTCDFLTIENNKTKKKWPRMEYL